MKTWLIRHRWAFPVIVVATALIGATVVYPAWWRNIGYLKAAQAVPFGESAEVDGVRWRLSAVPPPDFVDDDTTADTRPLLYVLTHETDGGTSSVPDIYAKCTVSFLDAQGRRWFTRPLPFGSYSWLETEGLTANCEQLLPLVVYAQVPTEADIVAVELLLNKRADEDSRVAPDRSELTAVIRFDTG